MPIIKDIDELVPIARDKCREFLKKCDEAGLNVVINETRRSVVTQMIYYLQGRLDVASNSKIIDEFNRLRKMTGFWELSRNEALNKRITWTFESKHIDGKAFDAVPIKDGKPWWNAPEDVWTQMGLIGESVGLIWGGRWTHKDYPHFEIA